MVGIPVANMLQPMITELLGVLGLEPKYVRSFSIHFPLDDAVRLEVTAFVMHDEIDGVIEVFKKYELELKEIVDSEITSEPEGDVDAIT